MKREVLEFLGTFIGTFSEEQCKMCLEMLERLESTESGTEEGSELSAKLYDQLAALKRGKK